MNKWAYGNSLYDGDELRKSFPVKHDSTAYPSRTGSLGLFGALDLFISDILISFLDPFNGGTSECGRFGFFGFLLLRLLLLGEFV